jgi:hypothetical protein
MAVTQERGQKRVYAFNDEAGFRRVAKAARFAEKLMKGEIAPQLHHNHPQPDSSVIVRTFNPNPSSTSTDWTVPSADALYPVEFLWFDPLMMENRVVADDENERYMALAFPSNWDKGDVLEVPDVGDQGTIYHGRVVGYYTPEVDSDPEYDDFIGVPVVEVTVGGGGAVVEDTFQFPLTYSGPIDPETCTVTLTVAAWQTVTIRAVGLEIEVS